MKRILACIRVQYAIKWVYVNGYKFHYSGMTLFVHKSIDMSDWVQKKYPWCVSEIKTGMAITNGNKTRNNAVLRAKEKIDNKCYGSQSCKDMVNRHVKELGLSPIYRERRS